MKNKNWREFIPTYLKDFCSQFTNYSLDKIHALIVEGKTDEEFYWSLFDKSYFILDNKKKIVFNTPKKKILYNFSNNFEDLFLRSEPYKLKQHQKDFGNADKSDYRGYLFVTECIKFFESNRDSFKNLDCFGMIDNDFGHSELILGLKNVSSTKYHDRETCIMRCYLPDYLEKCQEKEKAVKLLSEIMDVCFKQGIIEEVSHKFEKIEGYNKFLRKLTNYYFKDNCDKTDFRKTNFNLDDYLNNYHNYLDINPNGVMNDDFFKEAKSKIGIIYTFENELESIIHRWIIEKELNEVDNSRLDRIFKYCNGHMLLNQMILLGKDLFGFDKEETFATNVINNIVFGKQQYPRLFETLPLKPYKQYRLDNGLYKFM